MEWCRLSAIGHRPHRDHFKHLIQNDRGSRPMAVWSRACEGLGSFTSHSNIIIPHLLISMNFPSQTVGTLGRVCYPPGPARHPLPPQARSYSLRDVVCMPQGAVHKLGLASAPRRRTRPYRYQILPGVGSHLVTLLLRHITDVFPAHTRPRIGRSHTLTYSMFRILNRLLPAAPSTTPISELRLAPTLPCSATARHWRCIARMRRRPMIPRLSMNLPSS